MTFEEAFYSLLGLCSPPLCAACGKGIFQYTVPICEKCREEIVVFSQPRCLKCGVGLPLGVAKICGDCGKKRRLYSFAIPVGPYLGHLREMILSLKLRGFTSVSPYLAELLAEAVRYDGRVDADFLVLPVPVSRLSFRSRGYNQAGLIAVRLAKILGLQFSRDTLIKTRDTRRQDELTRIYRLSNLKDAFAVRGDVVGRKILLVDDVLTTGSTATECARTLKESGAATVAVACVAYTLPREYKPQEQDSEDL